MEVCTTAADLISNREYRCLSPNFLFHPETRAVAKLKGAGLVHNPHLYLTALARQESAMPNPETAPPETIAPAVATLAGSLGRDISVRKWQKGLAG